MTRTARRCSGPFLVALTVGAGLVVAPSGPAAAAPTPIVCPASGPWVGAWSAPASDGALSPDGPPSPYFPPVDPSLVPNPEVDNSTVRSVIVPTRAGEVLRVDLSNEYGEAPVTFTSVSVGKQATGAGVTNPVPLLFGGQPTVTVPAGGEVVSDPMPYAFQAFEALSISTFTPDDVASATRHWVARQRSYLTATGAGDKTLDTSGAAFGTTTTSRLFVTGMDTLAPGTGAVVTLGDSLTDGYQTGAPNPTGPSPELPAGLDENVRWPDRLARRINEQGLPLTVVNAGISGNRVGFDAAEGQSGLINTSRGDSALTRLDRDVLSVPNVRTVVLFEGINDLGQAPGVTVDQLTQNYQTIIDTLHQRGIRVLQGTITPAGGHTGQGSYGTSATNDLRNQVNEWIRTSSPADGVVDFDNAVADPANPSVLLPAYDDGDHLHLSAPGYQKLADTVALGQLADNCGSGSSGSSDSAWGSVAWS